MSITIQFNATAHRAACLDNLGPEDEQVYNAHIDAYVAGLLTQVDSMGYNFRVNQHEDKASTFTVLNAKTADALHVAHDAVQQLEGFWEGVA